VAKFLVEILVNALGEPEVRAAFDSIGGSAAASGAKVEKAQVQVEAALRRTQEAAAKLQNQMADTTKSNKMIADLGAANTKLGEQVTALKGGEAGLRVYAASTREAATAQQILVAQVRAGVAAESEAGQQIANLIRQQIAYNEQIAVLKAEMAGGLGVGGAGGAGGFSVSGVITGIGAAFSQIMALYASISLVKRGISEIVEAGAGIEGAMSQLSAGVISTGRAAGYSAQELMDMALQIQHATGKNQQLVASAESVLLTFTRIKGGQFYNALNDAIDISVRRHMSLDQAVLITGKLYEGFMANAKRVGIILTDEQQKTIKGLFDTGHAIEAQIMIHNLLQKSVGGSAEAYRNTLGGALEAAKSETQGLTRIIAEQMSPAIRRIAEDYIAWAQSAEGQQEIGKLGRELADVVSGLYETVKALSPALKETWMVLKSILEVVGLLGKGIGWLTEQMAIWRNGWMEIAENLTELSSDLTGVRTKIEDFNFDRLDRAATDSMQHVVDLRQEYGKLGTAAIEAAQSEIKAMEARAAALEQEAAQLRRTTPPSEAGYREDSGILKPENIEKARQAAEEATNLRNIIGNLNDRLKEHVKAAADAANSDENLGKAASDAMHNLMTSLKNAYDSGIKEAEAAKLGAAAYEEERIRAKVLTEQTKYLEEAHKAKTKATQADLDAIELYVRGAENAQTRVKAWIEAEKLLGIAHEELLKRINEQFGIKIDTVSIDKMTEQEQRLLPIQAALNDAINHTAIYTEAANIKRKVEIELGKQKHDLSAQEIKDIEDRIDRETKEEDLAKSRLSIQLALNQAEEQVRGARSDAQDWQAARDAATQYGAGVAAILQQYGLLSRASQQRAIEERLLAEQEKGATPIQLANMRQKLELDQDEINKLHEIQAQVEINERRYKELADSLATNLSSVFDNFVKTGKTSYEEVFGALRDSFRSVLSSIVKEWLQTWFQAMAQWLARWIATQVAAKAASAAVGAGGGGGEGVDASGAVTNIASSYAWSQWTGAGSTAGSSGGMGALFTGSGAGGAVGMVAAWAVALAAFGVAVNKLNDHMQKTEQDVIELNHSLDVSMPATGGGAHMDQLIAGGKQLAYNIQQFFTSFDGIFQSLDSSIGVKRRGRGNNTEWKVYVDGVVTSFGKDADAAMGYALIEAVKHSSSMGLDPLVVAAIKDYAGKSIDEFKQQVEFAQRLATQNLPGISGQLSSAAQQYFSDIHQAQTQFASDLSALNDAVASIAQKFSDTVKGIENSALGIDTSTADFLAALAGFQSQMQKTSGQVATQLQQMLDAAVAQLAGMGDHSARKPTGDAEDSAAIDAAWEKQRADLRAQIQKYADELAKIPKALTDEQVSMSVFDQLYKYLQGSGKYAAQAAAYAKMKVDIEFEAIKIQLIALNKWEEFAAMWSDALAAAENAAEQQARQKPGGGGNSIADQARSLREQIAKLVADLKGPVHSAFFDFQQQLDEFKKNAKAAHLSAQEIADGIAAMTKKFQQALLDQARTYAGIGTDFTAKLREVQKFFTELRQLGQDKTGMPKWQVDALEGKALAALGQQLDAALNQFNGLVDPMAAINAQADTLRQNVLAYGQAVGWNADQIKAALDKISQGVEYQRTSAINGIMDTLFGYLKDDAKYAQKIQDLKSKEVDLQFTLIQAQLMALGAWDASTKEIFDAAKKAAKEMADTANIYHVLGFQAGENHSGYDQNLLDAMNNAAKAWQDGIAQFTQQTQSLMLNPQLSGLSPQQQLASAQSNFRTLLAQAQGGDVNALGQLDQARQAYLQIARTMFGGGAGFDAIWNEVMSGSANVLSNAANEQVLAVQKAAHDTIAGAASNAAQTQAAIYAAADQVANAIWAALSGLPHYADGGIALRPHLALVGEKGPEAIIPLRVSPSSVQRTAGLMSPLATDTGRTGRLLSIGSLGGSMTWGGKGGHGLESDRRREAGVEAGMGKLAASIDRMTDEHKKAADKQEKRARRMEDHAAATARTNKEMAQAERIRTMIGKRSK